jgi:adenylosuccinate synthase
MPNIVLVGAQWGDEGKGKIIDILSEKSDIIIRFQGGNNAGHTVVIGNEEFILHLIPSGILHKGKTCVIGGGVVVDPEALLDEIDTLKKRGVAVDGSLVVSDQVHIIFPYHKLLDELREKKKEGTKIGTTKRGIGPCYADKASRCGIRLTELLNPQEFREKLKFNIDEKNAILSTLYGHKGFSLDEIYEKYIEYGKKIEKYMQNVPLFLNRAIAKGKSLLFEGAQGTLLDIDHGTYPFVTSSSATAGGACIGSGISPINIDKVVGVAKAYTTRVGEGPFPTEFEPDLMKKIREKGKEFGATTGRPRRCGWLDAVILKHAVMINGLTELALTKLDVLDDIDTIKVCVAYKCGDKILKDFPSNMEILVESKPIYEELPGWKEDTSSVTKYRRLPIKARKYITYISKFLNRRITMISVGSERRQTLIRV